MLRTRAGAHGTDAEHGLCRVTREPRLSIAVVATHRTGAAGAAHTGMTLCSGPNGKEVRLRAPVSVITSTSCSR